MVRFLNCAITHIPAVSGRNSDPIFTLDPTRREGLTGVWLENRKIDQLSGGQQQRVALARSLATRPDVLLLDEPLGSLDRLLRERLLIELKTILKKVGVTALYVTHDQSEAFGIGDRIAVMNAGKIEQIAPPQEIYTRPTSAFVASFLGLSNIIPVNEMPSPLAPWIDGRPTGGANVLIPPYAALIKDGETAVEELLQVSAEVINFSFRGRFALLNCYLGEHELEFSLDPYGAQDLIGRTFEAGQQIELLLDSNHFVLLKS